jgi:hypothetical protein
MGSFYPVRTVSGKENEFIMDSIKIILKNFEFEVLNNGDYEQCDAA